MPRNRSEKQGTNIITFTDAPLIYTPLESPMNYIINLAGHVLNVSEVDGHLSIRVERDDGSNGNVILNGQVISIDPIPF